MEAHARVPGQRVKSRISRIFIAVGERPPVMDDLFCRNGLEQTNRVGIFGMGLFCGNGLGSKGCARRGGHFEQTNQTDFFGGGGFVLRESAVALDGAFGGR